MQKPKRFTELSLMNVALCFTVIFMHVTGFAIGASDKSSWQFLILMPFWRMTICAVPGFIFLSAVKFGINQDRDEFSYSKYLLSRIKRVLIPYVIAVVVYFAVFYLLGDREFDISELLARMLDGNMSYHFYFVIVIMQFYLLAPLWRWLRVKLQSPVFAIIAAVTALQVSLIFGQYLADVLLIFHKGDVFPYCDRIFTTYIFWWILGLAVGANYRRVSAVITQNTLAVIVYFAFFTLCNIVFTYINLTGIASVWWLETLTLLYNFGAVMFLFAVSLRAADSKISYLAATSWFDEGAYSIYLWHPLMIHLGDRLTDEIPMSLAARLSVKAVFGFVITSFLCISAKQLCKKVKKSLPL